MNQKEFITDAQCRGTIRLVAYKLHEEGYPNVQIRRIISMFAGFMPHKRDVDNIIAKATQIVNDKERATPGYRNKVLSSSIMIPAYLERHNDIEECKKSTTMKEYLSIGSMVEVIDRADGHYGESGTVESINGKIWVHFPLDGHFPYQRNQIKKKGGNE